MKWSNYRSNNYRPSQVQQQIPTGPSAAPATSSEHLLFRRAAIGLPKTDHKLYRSSSTELIDQRPRQKLKAIIWTDDNAPPDQRVAAKRLRESRGQRPGLPNCNSTIIQRSNSYHNRATKQHIEIKERLFYKIPFSFNNRSLNSVFYLAQFF